MRWRWTATPCACAWLLLVHDHRPRPGAGAWREPGWLLADLDAALGDALAREFGQAGVLAWRRGEPVRLRMLLGRPAQAEPADHTDWAGA